MKNIQPKIHKMWHSTVEFVRKDYLPLLIIVTFFILIGQIIFYRALIASTATYSTKSDPFPHFEETAYPVLDHSYTPELSAQAALVLDASSHVAIYSKNENLRFPPASTTKLITALTALDYFTLEDVLTAKNPNVVPVVLGLKKGEQMTFENLLYAMLIPSANDAALTVSQNYPGGESAFIEKMNEKVAFLHLYNTHYADPVGLNDDDDYTTVHDLAIIASYALQHPVLSKMMDTKSTTIYDISGKPFHIENTNELLGKYGVYGGKTGYTEEAGQVLVSSTKMNNDHTYIIVVMQSQDRFGDTEKLLQLIENNISYSAIHPQQH